MLKVELNIYSLDHLTVHPVGGAGLETSPVLPLSSLGADLHSLQHFVKAGPAHRAVTAFLGLKRNGTSLRLFTRSQTLLVQSGLCQK